MGSIAQASGNLAAAVVGGQKITKEDLNLPQEKGNSYSPSGYDISNYGWTKTSTPPKLLGLRLMPGGY